MKILYAMKTYLSLSVLIIPVFGAGKMEKGKDFVDPVEKILAERGLKLPHEIKMTERLKTADNEHDMNSVS